MPEFLWLLPVGFVLGVGFLSSLLGIGGGIIHVPVMANLLHFPVHLATATSHFTLAIGVAIGAQAGASLARWVGGVWIIRFLVVALAFVGVRLIILAWQG